MSAVHQILRASAGTGKTFALVEAYLSQVEQGLRPSEIIAITFTRKAALELKHRIRGRLKKAGATHATLAELGQAPIGNFHGLALRLLRGLGRGSALPEGFEVLGEEGDDGLLFVACCHAAWFSGDPDVSRVVAALAPHLAIDSSLPEALWRALSQAREDDVTTAASALLGTYDWQTLRARQHTELLAFREVLAAARASLTDKSRAKVEASLAVPVPPADAPAAAWASAWLQVGVPLDRRGKLKDVFSLENQELLKLGVMLPVAGELCARLVGPLAMLIDSADREYLAAKKQLRVVDYGDLVARLADGLASDAALHAEVRARVKAVLVDEAQDTNRLQRRLVHLLAGLEGPAAAQSPPASLFVVGDRKQAIYTFRGADPASFELFVADIRAMGGSERPLAKSRRSSPELVDSINGLGRHLFGEGYEALEPDPDPKLGRVSIGRPGMTWLEVPQSVGSAVGKVAAEAAVLASWVRRQVTAGSSAGDFALLLPVTTRARLYASALAAIGIPAVVGGGAALYDRAEVVDTISFLAWLADQGDRLSAAVALRSPWCGLSEAALLALLAAPEGDKDPLSRLRGGDLADLSTGVASDGPAIGRLNEALPELVAAARFLGPAAVLEQMDALLDARAVLLGLDAGEQRVANLDRVLELARAFEERRGGSLRAFARQQLDRVVSGHQEPVAPVPAALRRAVTISSVHQAKGLQFPVVLLADLRHAPRTEGSSVAYVRGAGLVFRPYLAGEALKSDRWVAATKQRAVEREAEQRRLLYVAVTRAQREVILFGAGPGQGRRTGFCSYLEPWRDAATAAGWLAVEAAPVPERVPASTSPATPTVEDQAWASEALASASAPVRAPNPTLIVAATTLETFLQCPRRGFFAHELRLSEPGFPDHGLRWPLDEERDPPLTPLARGRLTHAVLAAMDRCPGADGVVAFVDAELTRLGVDADDPRLGGLRDDLVAFLSSAEGRQLLSVPAASCRAELPFSLSLVGAAQQVIVHGQIDLLCWTDEGPWVIDYKHAKRTPGAEGRYQLQLELYALAAERLCGVEGEVRTTLFFLQEQSPAHTDRVSPTRRRRLEQRILEALPRIGEGAPAGTAWPGLPRVECRALGCGFLSRCHPTGC